MSREPLPITPELHNYLVDHGTPPDYLFRDLAEETAKLTGSAANMQIAPEQAAFMTILARVVNARHAVEIGTFTGMSSIALARGLKGGGMLHCFDISEEYTSIARRYWERAMVKDRITLHLGPALEKLAEFPSDPPLDISFIDADKENYRFYWEALVPRTRRDGVILVDNVLWGGEVLDPDPNDTAAQAIVKFNDVIKTDPRVDVVMLPIADGLTLARKR